MVLQAIQGESEGGAAGWTILVKPCDNLSQLHRLHYILPGGPAWEVPGAHLCLFVMSYVFESCQVLPGTAVSKQHETCSAVCEAGALCLQQLYMAACLLCVASSGS